MDQKPALWTLLVTVNTISALRQRISSGNGQREFMKRSIPDTSFVSKVTATLSVLDWPAAMRFYTSAFGAVETYSVPGGGVGRLSIDGAEFWVAEESKEHQNFSPESLGGCSVRMLLIVSDPQQVCRQAVACGAIQIVPVAAAHGWTIGRILDPFGHHWEVARVTE